MIDREATGWANKRLIARPKFASLRQNATVEDIDLRAPRGIGDGRYARLLDTLSRVDLLILDDRGLAPFTGEQRRDLLEVVDDRHQRGSTIITSQIPIDHW